MTYVIASFILLLVMGGAAAVVVGQALRALIKQSELRTDELKCVLHHLHELQTAEAIERQNIIRRFTTQIDSLLDQAHAQREQLLTRISDPQVAITQVPVSVGNTPDVEVYDELAELREEQPDLFDADGNLKVGEDSEEFLDAIRPVTPRQPFGADNGSGS